MRNEGVFNNIGPRLPRRLQPQAHNNILGFNIPRKAIVGFMMIVALLAFEIFNFDTTRYALQSLLGDVSFAGLRWAAILAIAFCAIDFAGLARLFTPEQGDQESKAIWYLMGAWLLGATMNAVMTWWAVSLTLLAHDFGNEVLSRQQLLKTVPVFVAALVWLTRILFIGAFTVAGEHIFQLTNSEADGMPYRPVQQRQARPIAPGPEMVSDEEVMPIPQRPVRQIEEEPVTGGYYQTRVHKRPPITGRMPGSGEQRMPVGMEARRRR